MTATNHMQAISDGEVLEQMKVEGAVCILFGSEHCGVCDSLRPQIGSMLATHFPRITGVYVDCEKTHRICAQHGVFSLPAVNVYIEGMLIAEDARAFSLNSLMQRIERTYALWIESNVQ